jgi:pilus assembly protein FimV
LGKLSVLSALGQPLKAEIEIVSLQRGEGDSLAARLAPGDAFRQANIELNPALLSVKFAVERRSGGQYVMKLTSGQPINEPFLDLLVELNWANGRLVREYTFLLDPPEYAALRKAEPIQSVQPPQVAPLMPLTPPQAAFPPGPIISAQTTPAGPTVTASAAPAESAATPQAAAVESPVPAQIALGESAPQVEVLPADILPAGPVSVEVEAVSADPSPVARVEEPGISRTYEVKRGDTLSKIARRNRIEGVAFQQMLVALFRANQEAFVADNMNRLRAGKIISIPDRDAAAAVTLSDSRRIVSAQYADFNDYRRSLGIAVASAPGAREGGRQVTGQISAPKEEKPAPSKEPPKDQLRLSRADDAKRGAKAAGTAAADDLAAKENALNEANERIALLEKNLQDMQKLTQIKSQTGTQLEQQAQAAKSAPPSPSAKAAPGAKAPEPATKEAPAAKASEAAKAVPSAKATEPAAKTAPAAKADAPKSADLSKADANKAVAPPATAPEAAKVPEAAKAPQAAKAPEPAKPDATKASPKAAAKAKAAPPSPPIEVSLLDELHELLDNPLALGGAGGAVILLAGYAAYAWRRKRSSQFENSIMSVVSTNANSVLGTEGGRNVDTGSSSFQSDFSEVGKLDTEEIDPIAEADVYMAYGRDAQAEEILKDALVKDSSRQAVRVKLLEIYANRKDARAFEAAANELHSATGGRGAEWEKVASLGLSIDPTNPLYGGKPQAATKGFADTAQFPAFGGPVITEPVLEAEAPLNIDFDIGAATGGGPTPVPDINLDAGSSSSAESASAGLDFDLGLGGDKPAGGAMIAAAPLSAAAPAAEPALSIDFDLPLGDRPVQAQAVAPPDAPAADLGAIDFDLGTPAAVAEARTETTQVQSLDLSSIDLDLGTPGAGNGSGGAPDARWQEVATKLDLAKAYEEMGDKDGARELLKEVVTEGDAAQQQKAQTMLQALGRPPTGF